MLTRLAHILTFIALVTLLLPGLSQASQPAQPTPAAAQQSKSEWLLQTFDQQNNPIASVPLVIATKHEGFLPVAAICGAKSMRVQGDAAQLLEIESITVWSEAELCRITVKAPGFPGELAPQREEKLKAGERVSPVRGFDKSTSDLLRGYIQYRASFESPATYRTSIAASPELISQKVYDESGKLVGFALKTHPKGSTKELIDFQSVVVADLASSRSKAYSPDEWMSLQTHQDDAAFVRAVYLDGLVSTNRSDRVGEVSRSLADKIDLSDFVLREVMATIVIDIKLSNGRDIPQRCLNQNPESECAKLTEAILLYREEKFRSAISLLETLHTSREQLIAVRSKGLLGRCYLTTGKVSEGLELLEQLQTLHPEYERVLATLASHYVQVKDASNLERIVAKLLPLDWSLDMLAVVSRLAEMSKREDALRILEDLVPRCHIDTDLRAAVAVQFNRYDMKAKVLEILRDGIRSAYAASNDYELLYAYEHKYKDRNLQATALSWQEKAPSLNAFMRPAKVLLKEGNKDEAFEMLSKGHSLFAQDPSYITQYTTLLLLADRKKEAIKVVEQACIDLPNEPYLKVLLATAYAANYQFELGKQACEEVLESFPEDPDAMFILAQMHRFQGNMLECQNWIKRVKALPPAKLEELRERWKAHSAVKLLN